jgi:hypothetical protein
MPQSKVTQTAFLDLKIGSNITHTHTHIYIYIYIFQPKDIFTKPNAAVTTVYNLLLKPKNQNDQPKHL